MVSLSLKEVKQLVKAGYKECQSSGNTMTADHLLLSITLLIKEKEHVGTPGSRAREDASEDCRA